MALWSAALFGHYKPKDFGWERRAEPGDIIAIRPYSEHSRWTPLERKHFLIVTLDDIERQQLEGTTEPQWDIESYPEVSEEAVQGLIKDKKTEYLHPQRYIKKRRFHITLDDLRDIGVDIDLMLDKEKLYCPEIDPINKVKFYDKLNNRYTRETDGLNVLAPKVIGKLS